MNLYKIFKVTVSPIFRILYRIEVIGKENVISQGRMICCSNHTNNLDPIILAMTLPREINYMAKKEIFKNKLLAKLLYKLGTFPVDRQASDITAIKTALKILKDENVLGIFPEGTRVKELNLNNVKPGIALLSIKSQAPILPIYIEGNYKLFSKIKVIFGQPFDFSDSYGKKLNTEDYKILSQDILKSIYSLKSK